VIVPELVAIGPAFAGPSVLLAATLDAVLELDDFALELAAKISAFAPGKACA